MAEENHTIRLLTEMRKEIRETRDEMREGFDEVDKRFEQVDKRFEEAREERSALRQRLVEGELRVSTELLAVSGAIDEVKGIVRQQSAIKMVVTEHERRIRKLEGE